MNKLLDIRAVHWIKPYDKPGHLQIVETAGKEHAAITELITQLTLRGSFYLIAGGEWLPDQDDLRYSVYRYTVALDETLDNLILARPFTCLQLLDLLIEADLQSKPMLILDFLHLFHDPNAGLSLRDRTLELCCWYLKRLSLSNPVVVFVPRLLTEEYRRFFPILASVADEIIPMAEDLETKTSQGSLF